MFNFKVMNRALTDSNLTDKEFRMLYAINNNCSLNNSNSVEMYNAQLMLMLNISERWVRNLTNQLVSKGYISKEIKGTSQNKQANIYTLLEVEVNDTPTNSLCNESVTQKFPLTDIITTDKNNDTEMIHESVTQKFPLKNNNKINKNNIYNNIDHIPVDDITVNNINIKEKNNKKENTTIDNPIPDDNRNNFNDDINNSGNISEEEERELDQLINNIPTLKEYRSINKQENITINPTIEEDNNNSSTSDSDKYTNPKSIVLTFPVTISGSKQEININVECNDINSLTPQEKFAISANLNHRIFLMVPEVFKDGYWTKDCCSSYPSPYEFENVLLPDSIKRYNLKQDQLEGNSAPAPDENTQGGSQIALNIENDKEYHPTQDNATGAKTEANMRVEGINNNSVSNFEQRNIEKRSLIAPNNTNGNLYHNANKKPLEAIIEHKEVDELIKAVSNQLRKEEKEDIFRIDMYKIFNPLQNYLINHSDKNVREYGLKRLEQIIDNINKRTILFENSLEIILNSTKKLLHKNIAC